MADYEKVVRGLEDLRENMAGRSMGYLYRVCCDALVLLKEQKEIIDRFLKAPDAMTHCKDCKHGRIYENCVKCENAGNPGMFATYHQIDWFCADGECKD